MKKEYIQPEVRVCEIEMQTLLTNLSAVEDRPDNFIDGEEAC